MPLIVVINSIKTGTYMGNNRQVRGGEKHHK
jgi:hypothetical protein